MITAINKILQRVRSKKAQALSEYAIVIGIVVAALLSMQIFIKRRAQAIIQDSISEFGDPNYVEAPSPLLPGRELSSNFITETTALTEDVRSGSTELITKTERRTGSGNIMRQEGID